MHADAVRAQLADMYQRGLWDPERPQPTDPATAQEQTPRTTVVAYARVWIATQRYESAPKDAARIENYLARAPLGAVPIGEVRPRHLKAFVAWLQEQTVDGDEEMAPRTVRNIYDVVRRALNSARVDELLLTDPCGPLRGILPTIEDKDPEAREGWEFTRAEVETLISDARVPAPRRVVYALLCLTGMRHGELAALRWRDWDRTLEPLTRLTVARAIKSVSGEERRTKTGAKKLVPVHPTLEAVLRAWRAEGWAELIGRAPEPDDLLIPNKLGRPRNVSRDNRDLGRDLKRLKFRDRHQYVMRHTFITRCQDDGADGSVLRWATHAPPRTAFDGYTRAQWGRLCEEVAKLRVELRPTLRLLPGLAGNSPTNSPTLAGETKTAAVLVRPLQSGREDLKRSSRHGPVGNPSCFPSTDDTRDGSSQHPRSNSPARATEFPGPWAPLYQWHDAHLLAELEAEELLAGPLAPGGDA